MTGNASAGGPGLLSDAALLARGDGDAFAEFYRRHARRLAGYLVRATSDAEAAADLTAETFAAARQVAGATVRSAAPARPP
jgi:DNA-directed RNA polymerase specialized sigma24 family protein